MSPEFSEFTAAKKRHPQTHQAPDPDIPLFKALRLLGYSRLAGLVHNVVTVCLKEEGVLS